MTMQRMTFFTILSLLLIAVLFPTAALASPRGQMDRQGYSANTNTSQQPSQEAPVYNPPAPSNPSPPQNGGSDSDGNTFSSNRESFRSRGGYVPSAPAPAPPAEPAPAPSPPTPPAEIPAAPSAPSWMTPDEAQAFVLLNEFRIKNGVPPVSAHQALTEVARLKANDMAENNYFAHNSPTYGSPGNMARQAGISFRSLGENLSGAGNVRQAHIQLENSSGHRRIMLNENYEYVGIGIDTWKTSPGIVMVQLFIRQ